MLEQLVEAKKIPPEAYELYMLFQANELGRKVLERMTIESFMDEAKRMEFGDQTFAFYDGRRSLIRDIRWSITLVEDAIKEATNV